MSKEVFIALIQKDLRELNLLAQGLYENEVPSPTFVTLATEKAQEVISNLKKLSELKTEAPVEKIIPEEKKEEKSEQIIETPVIEEKADLAIEEVKIIQEEIIPKEIIETELVVNNIPEQKEIVEKATNKINTSTETKIEGLSISKEGSLASSLANKKITDIKQAISIADRFRFQRELFDNNGEKMNATLSKLNTFTSASEAEIYLKSFAWNSESETVLDFMNIVNRLFV